MIFVFLITLSILIIFIFLIQCLNKIPLYDLIVQISGNRPNFVFNLNVNKAVN